MKIRYSIKTDDGSIDVEAGSVNEAVKRFMGPKSKVRTLIQLEKHLRKLGGYGIVEEDGMVILKVE